MGGGGKTKKLKKWGLSWVKEVGVLKRGRLEPPYEL